MIEQHAVESSKNLLLWACVSQRRWTNKTKKRISLKWIISIPHYSVSFLRLSLISAFSFEILWSMQRNVSSHTFFFTTYFLHFILRCTSSQQIQELCGTHSTRVWEAVLGEVCVTVSVNLFEDITCFKTNGKSGFRCYRSVCKVFSSFLVKYVKL